MSKGIFTDKNSKPAERDILKTIGKAKKNWDPILLYLSTDLKCRGEFKFYGINYGWAIRFNKYGKSIAALYPGKDCFTVQIILNKNQVDSALSAGLEAGLIKIIEEKEAIHEGKWIYLKIDQNTELEDVFKLVDIRIKIK